MTDPEMIAQARELDARATAAPWEFGGESGVGFLYSDNPGIDADVIPGLADVQIHEDEQGVENLRFIATSRTLLPALANRLEAVIAERDGLRKAVEDAPHEERCMYLDKRSADAALGRGRRFSCDCWKSRALAALAPETKPETLNQETK